MSEALQLRTRIIEAARQRIEHYYGPSGELEKLFRDVRQGPYRPTKVRPTCTVTDNGQTSVQGDDDITSARMLGMRLVLDLAADWTKVAKEQEWTDRVELLVALLHNWLPEDCGMLAMKYSGDEPVDPIFISGEAPAIWVIDFDATYFVECNEPEDWEE